MKPHPLALFGDARNTEGRGQMRLARARPAHQHHVVRSLGELQRRQPADQGFIDRRSLEVEASQVAVHRETRRTHLVTNRAHGPIRGLGLQQVLQQPVRFGQLVPPPLLGQLGPGRGHAVQAQKARLAHSFRCATCKRR